MVRLAVINSKSCFVKKDEVNSLARASYTSANSHPLVCDGPRRVESEFKKKKPFLRSDLSTITNETSLNCKLACPKIYSAWASRFSCYYILCVCGPVTCAPCLNEEARESCGSRLIINYTPLVAMREGPTHEKLQILL